MGNHRKCVHCDKPAMAYHLEGDGSRIYLCEDHVPCGDEEHTSRPELRLVPPSAKTQQR
jgi:hypothetical protein